MNEPSNTTIEKVIGFSIDNYAIHYNTKDNTVYFEVYPIQEWYNPTNGDKGFHYLDKEDLTTGRNDFDKDLCLKKFEGSYCWRGVWESRLYFTDEEYWGEELKDMSDLFDKHIEPWSKSFIKKQGYGDNE